MTWHPIKTMVDKSLAPLKPLVDGEGGGRSQIDALRKRIAELELENLKLRSALVEARAKK
jgi:hypothetical protein